jgi:hypothetical protein
VGNFFLGDLPRMWMRLAVHVQHRTAIAKSSIRRNV